MRIALPIAVATLLISGCNRNDRNASGRPIGTTGELTTVTGCVTSDAQGRYVLTADRSDLGSAGTAATSGAVPTYTYQLVGGQDLPNHVGNKVEVVGHVSSKEADAEFKNKTRSDQPRPDADAPKPRVETREKIDLEIRQMQVQSVRALGASCTPDQR